MSVLNRPRLLFIANALMDVKRGDTYADRVTGKRYRVTKVKPLAGSIWGSIYVYGKPR